MNVNFAAMNGSKMYRFLNEEKTEVGIIRIIHVTKNSKNEVVSFTIKDENGSTRKVKPEDIKDYTMLLPDGILTVNAVEIADETGKSSEDVIVTATRFADAQSGKIFPFAICRQSITNLFYNIAVKDESEMRSGMSLNQMNCPAGFDIGLMVAANKIIKSDFINFYLDEKVEDVLKLIPITKYNSILANLYSRHVKASNNPALTFKKEDKGWCKDLLTLLDMNGFQNDVNEMLNITDIEFDISDFIVKKPMPWSGEGEMEYDCANDELLAWLSYCTKKNIVDAPIIEYGYDIDLDSENFLNSDHFLLRDKTNKVYVVFMTLEGEYHEADLTQEMLKEFQKKFKLKFYQSINQNNNDEM